MFSRTVLTNEHIDLLIAHSRQTRIISGINKYIDDEHEDKATQKAQGNSTKLLEMTFLGNRNTLRKKRKITEKMKIVLFSLRCQG
jgi:hypothetical protein